MPLSWQLDPVLIGGLLTLGVTYTLAVGPLRQRLAPGTAYPTGKAALFYLALLIIYLAEGSPLHDLAELYLFSAHMIQHNILSYVVPPLFIAGVPRWLWQPLLLNRWVKPLARFLTRPLVALLVFSFAFSVWHFPAIYEGALRNSLVHHLEHVVFIGTALLLWWPIMSPLAELPRLGPVWQVVYLFLLPIAQFLAPAFLTFSQVPFYPTYINAPRLMGLTPLMDQQLGGAIMKIAGFIAFGIPLTLAFFRWYAHESGPATRIPSQPQTPPLTETKEKPSRS